MTNFYVCLLLIFCCTNLSSARQSPKECTKGPEFWCENLKNAAACGAVGHCIADVWEKQDPAVTKNEISTKFVKLFRELKDIKDLLNEGYLAIRVGSACKDVRYPNIASLCGQNTVALEKYLIRVLTSDTSAETMCRVIGMCNNKEVERTLAKNKKVSQPEDPKTTHSVKSVGDKRCTWGPSYWCNNISTSHECKAVHHCVERYWSTKTVLEDNNSICKICTDMVKQARDQLASNQTQEDLEADFERSCKRIPIKLVSEECMKLTDEFVPELMETLASEMKPQVVCSVAGLCNNDKIDQLLLDYNKKVSQPEDEPKTTHSGKLVGDKPCTWGPSYWCNNISSSHECKAVHHCVERVWSTMTVPEDTDSICKICTDMVKQARDQLTSNQTQEDLKAVFEGSCKLIPIKVVSEECMKLADDFVPELVETLASQMNPQVVCSVAGLCNNARIDQLLQDYNAVLNLRAECTNCRKTVGVLRKKFDATSYEDFLYGLLQVCGKAGSLSDSCSMLVFKYYEKILAAVRKDLTPESMCHLSAQCSYQFHSHPQYTFPEEDELKATDDVPCEFCEQLVKHLRDVLIANTTELEFHKILTGLCKQTGEFKAECIHLVDEYYDTIYNFLVSDLNPQEVCSMMGVCGVNKDVVIAPLLPAEIVVKAITPSSKLIGVDEANSYKNDKRGRAPLQTKQTNVRIISDGTESEAVTGLPIERMFVQLPQNKATCSFCQYFLHYLQVELSDTKTEAEITDAVGKACDKLPKNIDSECKTFVNQYGPAVIALLVQEIDPSSVCPALGLCPKTTEVRLVTINADKSNCALCLFAIEQLETVLQNNRSEKSIQDALDGLCNHLSQKLKTECVDFVDTYSKQLVEMLVADMNAQEICVFLKLCKDNSARTDPLKLAHSGVDKYHDRPQLRQDMNIFRKKSLLPKHMLGVDGDIETNEIPDNTVNGLPLEMKGPSTVCVICEFVLKEIDDQIKDKNNEDEIKQAVHNVCKIMPKSVKSECDQFVDKYADMVISLLVQELEPSEVCRQLKLCKDTLQQFAKVKGEILDCAVCETVVLAVKKVLSNDKVDHDIVHIIEKSCGLLPAKYNARCHTMMEIYGDSVIHLIETLGMKGVCQKIGLCSEHSAAYVQLNYRPHRN